MSSHRKQKKKHITKLEDSSNYLLDDDTKPPNPEVAQMAKWAIRTGLLFSYFGMWFVFLFYHRFKPSSLMKHLYKEFNLSALSISHLFDPFFWLTTLCLSTPHVLYFLVWTRAERWKPYFQRFGEPYQVFAKIAHFLKLFQICCFSLWYFGWDWFNLDHLLSAPASFISFLTMKTLPELLCCFQLIGYGQWFNIAVYNAIGEAGVYYGVRLGKEIPWCFSFPFNAIPHAQYFGSVVI
jgi:hypothetical protein